MTKASRAALSVAALAFAPLYMFVVIIARSGSHTGRGMVPEVIDSVKDVIAYIRALWEK